MFRESIKAFHFGCINKLSDADKNKFIHFFFNELRHFLVCPLGEHAKAAPFFEKEKNAYYPIKILMVALSHCSLFDRPDDELNTKMIQTFLAVEKNMVLVYHAIRKIFIRKINEREKIIIGDFYFRLHLIVQTFYPLDEKINSNLACPLPDKLKKSVLSQFSMIVSIVSDPIHYLIAKDKEFFYKEACILYDLYRLSDLTNIDTHELVKDMLLLTDKYPKADHQNILKLMADKFIGQSAKNNCSN